MSTPDDRLSGLVERLEKATKNSHQLNQEIFALVQGWSYPLHGAALEEWESTLKETGLVSYTSSIDAAMTLVPEGWSNWWMIARGAAGVTAAELRKYPDIGTKYDEVQASSYSTPIAICIAGLKAQLSTRTHEQDDARDLSGASPE